ncbi:MAG TPA: hypothetical protein VGG19_13005 [Tepidisphaeraceae bacterium]
MHKCEDAGYQLTNHLRADFPIAADINPGTLDFGDDPLDATPTSLRKVQMAANSDNHERDGQNVLNVVCQNCAG